MRRALLSIPHPGGFRIRADTTSFCNTCDRCLQRPRAKEVPQPHPNTAPSPAKPWQKQLMHIYGPDNSSVVARSMRIKSDAGNSPFGAGGGPRGSSPVRPRAGVTAAWPDSPRCGSRAGPRLGLLGPRGCSRLPPATQPVHPSTTRRRGVTRAWGSAPLLLGEGRAQRQGQRGDADPAF